jgi:cytochrome c peroxidase
MALANVMWSPDLNWDGAKSKLEEQARVPLESPIEMHQAVSVSVQKLQKTSTYPALFRKAFGSSTITEENLLKALAQFERTLVSANSRYDRSITNTTLLSADEKAGRDLFFTHAMQGVRGAECFHCHNAPTFASPRNTFFNNGLDITFTDQGRGAITGKAADMGMFKAPTLRNIALTAPYMHDGRFKTLEEVLDHYSDHVQLTSPGLHVSLQESTNNPFTKRMNLEPYEKRQIIAFLHTLTDSSFVNNPKFSDPH